MTQYTISVKDESKASHVLALLKDLAYIDVFKRDTQSEQQAAAARKRPSEIITPVKIDNLRLFSRDELNER
ncbi:MAG: hypothetical protein LBI42_11210 [Chitinispirillales bacterium]|jgi:hypothetical protein|nr:hypothetical protein [Chitinispirillales bacterium]